MALCTKGSLIRRPYFQTEVEKCHLVVEIFIKVSGSMENSKELELTSGRADRNTMESILMGSGTEQDNFTISVENILQGIGKMEKSKAKGKY